MFDLRLMGLLAGVLVVALSGWLGYDYGSSSVRADWEAERAAQQSAVAGALSTLAAGVQDAERRYEDERAKKQRVVTRTLTEVRYAVSQLPVRDCPLLPDAHSLLLRAHCAAAGASAATECVPNAVLPDAAPAPSTKR